MTIKVTTTEELYSKVLVVYGYGCGVWLQGGCMNPTFVTKHNYNRARVANMEHLQDSLLDTSNSEEGIISQAKSI